VNKANLNMTETKIDTNLKNSDDGKGILITSTAVQQISNLLKSQIDKNALRVGVRSGGCSGMSYTMDFIAENQINSDDKIYEYSLSNNIAFKVVCDPKSLLYIYGMQLDFSTELIGGGFNFTNPNASQTCGCGSSFAV
tara:strand:+ start:1328 stop:1741 length:414 start_codon:yes stop_codon:yes gene_type:complete